jgi:hypothetical protein
MGSYWLSRLREFVLSAEEFLLSLILHRQRSAASAGLPAIVEAGEPRAPARQAPNNGAGHVFTRQQ